MGLLRLKGYSSWSGLFPWRHEAKVRDNRHSMLGNPDVAVESHYQGLASFESDMDYLRGIPQLRLLEAKMAHSAEVCLTPTTFFFFTCSLFVCFTRLLSLLYQGRALEAALLMSVAKGEGSVSLQELADLKSDKNVA